MTPTARGAPDRIRTGDHRHESGLYPLKYGGTASVVAHSTEPAIVPPSNRISTSRSHMKKLIQRATGGKIWFGAASVSVDLPFTPN